jgi:hypothetical protein
MTTVVTPVPFWASEPLHAERLAWLHEHVVGKWITYVENDELTCSRRVAAVFPNEKGKPSVRFDVSFPAGTRNYDLAFESMARNPNRYVICEEPYYPFLPQADAERIRRELEAAKAPPAPRPTVSEPDTLASVTSLPGALIVRRLDKLIAETERTNAKLDALHATLRNDRGASSVAGHVEPPPGTRGEPFSLGFCIAEPTGTELSLRVWVKDFAHLPKKYQKAWIPRSAVHQASQIQADGEEGELLIPWWLADSSRLSAKLEAVRNGTWTEENAKDFEPPEEEKGASRRRRRS